MLWIKPRSPAFAGSRNLTDNAPMDEPPTGLSTTQRHALGDKLRTRQRELRSEIAKQMRHQDDPRLTGMRNRMEDTDDWAVADMMALMDIATVSRDLNELSEVETALAKLADGSYGECVDCGDPIPYPRLEAYPAARRCVSCQQVFEAGRRRTG